MTTAPKSTASNPDPNPDGVAIGHVHLRVSFYFDVLGFDLMQRYGDEAAFLSAGGYHHHTALNTWEGMGGSQPPVAFALSGQSKPPRPSDTPRSRAAL